MELDTLLTNPVVIFHKACQFVICILKNKIYRYKELLILIANEYTSLQDFDFTV